MGWRQDFRILLADNPNKKLDRRYPLIARNVHSNFPAIDAVSLYANPITSWTTGQLPDFTSWSLRPPDLNEITLLCEKYFSWGSLCEIAPRFQSTLWPGLVCRYLLLVSQKTSHTVQVSRNNYYITQLPNVKTRFMYEPFINLHILKIYQSKIGPGPPSHSPNVHSYSIEVSTECLVPAAGYDWAPEETMSGPKSATQKTHIWVPASILKKALPSLVERFHRDKHNSPPETVNHPSVRYT